MKHIVLICSLLCSTQAQAQVTGGERYYDGYSEHWRDEQAPYEPQREKRLNRDELGGQNRSDSDYVYGTRDPHERDSGGSGNSYSRGDYYRDDGY